MDEKDVGRKLKGKYAIQGGLKGEITKYERDDKDNFVIRLACAKAMEDLLDHGGVLTLGLYFPRPSKVKLIRVENCPNCPWAWVGPKPGNPKEDGTKDLIAVCEHPVWDGDTDHYSDLSYGLPPDWCPLENMNDETMIFECQKCGRKAGHPFELHASSKLTMDACDGEVVLIKLKDAW